MAELHQLEPVTLDFFDSAPRADHLESRGYTLSEPS